MTKKADIGSKRLISLAPDNWVRWLTKRNDLKIKEFLSSEFQWVSRDNDVLLKVFSPTEGEFLILNELQLRYNSKMPRRIRAYTALAEERYNLPLYPILVNILPSTTTLIESCYQSEFMGIKAYQDYQVINLWEVEVDLVFQEEIATLLPFVPILKGGGNETIVRQALTKLRANETLNELEPLLSFFASFVFEISILQQIMRWDMTVLRESPWYQEILKEGLQKGEAQGLQQGEKQGEANLIIRLLSKRFGNLNPNMITQIRQLEIAQLELLGEGLFDFQNLTDVDNWLKENI
jgi:predicted transposase YdaD